VTVSRDRVSERIIQIDKSDEFEDALEKQAIGEVYPWLIQNRIFVVPANAMLLVIFCAMFYTLRKRIVWSKAKL
jgi:predicted alpha-1,6-mannanase (GH76 family)